MKYFVESIEKWRSIKQIDKMNVVAHSFSSYVMAKYALFYPDKIAKLVFLSPFGGEKPPEDPNKYLQDKTQESDWFTKQVIKCIMCLWRRDVTPQSTVRVSGRYFGGAMIK